MEFFEKIDKKPDEDLAWNIPEKKQGIVNIVGGNSQNFKNEIKISEFLGTKYPLETLNTVLPDVLKNQLPSLPNFKFLKSTDSGSFADEREILDVLNSGEYNLVLGDLSKNSITGKVIQSAIEKSKKPVLVTRDTIDLMTENMTEKGLMNENLIIFGSMIQMQKVFRAVYYPKMLLLSQPLTQVTEIFHKFTLSYPVSVITLHNNQILVVKNGNVKVIPLELTGHSMIKIWQGEVAAKIVALNLYNPNNFIKATISALFS